MAEFKKWTSYLYAYSGEVKGNNVGFARVEVRDGRCRLAIGVKGAYGCDAKGLNVGIYTREEGQPQRVSIGTMRIAEGCGEYEKETDSGDLFGKKLSWEDWCGLWLTSPERDTVYLASWEKAGLNAREFLVPSEAKVEICQKSSSSQAMVQESAAAQSSQEVWPQERSLWDSLNRYYPKIWPQWQQRGVELLKIRPTDIRYLPRRLWFYSNNSFLLHGYYQYKHLILGRITDEENCYLLGVPGRRDSKESYWAEMFGFHYFLPVQEHEGYWYTKIRL